MLPRVIPPETTQFLAKKKSWSKIFSPSSLLHSICSIKVHIPEYQPPVTSDSRITGCTNFVN